MKKVTKEVENVEVVEIAEAAPVNFTDGLTLAEFIDSDKGRELGYKAASKYWKENGAKTKNTGFRAKFYAALKAGNLTEAETLAFAENNGGSDNDIKQISHFVSIADLAREIREDLTKSLETEAAK